MKRIMFSEKLKLWKQKNPRQNWANTSKRECKAFWTRRTARRARPWPSRGWSSVLGWPRRRSLLAGNSWGCPEKKSICATGSQFATCTQTHLKNNTNIFNFCICQNVWLIPQIFITYKTSLRKTEYQTEKTWRRDLEMSLPNVCF